MEAGTFNQPQQGYPQHGYGQPAYAAPQARGRSGMAIAGLVLGVIALLTFWIWGAILFAPLAIIFGILGRNEARKRGMDGEGMGTAGLALGVVAIVLTIPWAFYVASL